MSWRLLFLFLVLVAAGSAIGGVELGEWLIAHAPESISQASTGNSRSDLVLDANGKPFTPQPPQPRIDGTLGVPREMAPVAWTITAVTALQLPPEQNATQVGDDEPHEQPAAGTALPGQASDIATVDVSGARGAAPVQSAAAGQATGSRPATPSAGNATRTASAPGASAAQSASGWQQTLRREIELCNNLGFFQRPSCVQNARNKFCGINDGWGNVPECPARTFDRPGA